MAASKNPFNAPMPRRQFLKASSAAAIGLAASGLLRPDALFAGDELVIPQPLLGVGFTPDEIGTKSVRLMDAAYALSGDPSFIRRGARLTIGSFNALQTRSKSSSPGAVVEALFPVLGKTTDSRFHAWSYRAKGSGVEAGSTSFVMPVVATDGVRLVVRSLAREGADPKSVAAAQSPLTLSLGSKDGAYKLQKGTYVVAFRDEVGSDATPMWDRLTIARREGNELVVSNARFSYVVVTIDYATEK